MCLFHLLTVFVLIGKIVYTGSHSFVIGKDGALQMIGYDVNGVYKSLAIDGNIKFKGPNSANISFEQNSSLLLISGNTPDSFNIGTSENPKLFHIDTTFQQEYVSINGSLSIAGDIDISHSSTMLIVSDQDERALEINLKGFPAGNKQPSKQLLSLNTSGRTPILNISGGILSPG